MTRKLRPSASVVKDRDACHRGSDDAIDPRGQERERDDPHRHGGPSFDPVGAGFIASLARPGGNITGLTFHSGPEIVGKQLELAQGGHSSSHPVGAQRWAGNRRDSRRGFWRFCRVVPAASSSSRTIASRRAGHAPSPSTRPCSAARRCGCHGIPKPVPLPARAVEPSVPVPLPDPLPVRQQQQRQCFDFASFARRKRLARRRAKLLGTGRPAKVICRSGWGWRTTSPNGPGDSRHDRRTERRNLAHGRVTPSARSVVAGRRV